MDRWLGDKAERAAVLSAFGSDATEYVSLERHPFISHEDESMRFLAYTLGDESLPMRQPGPDEMAAMGPFMEEALRAGVLVATGALAPTSEGVKVHYSGGSFTVTDGPFGEVKELIGGWALLQSSSMDEAVGWAKRFLAIVGVDGAESRIRQVYGPEDGGPNAG